MKGVDHRPAQQLPPSQREWAARGEEGASHYLPRLLPMMRVPVAPHLHAAVHPVAGFCLLLQETFPVLDATRAEAVVGVVDLLLICKIGKSGREGSCDSGRLGQEPRGAISRNWRQRCPSSAPPPCTSLPPPCMEASGKLGDGPGAKLQGVCYRIDSARGSQVHLICFAQAPGRIDSEDRAAAQILPECPSPAA